MHCMDHDTVLLCFELPAEVPRELLLFLLTCMSHIPLMPSNIKHTIRFVFQTTVNILTYIFTKQLALYSTPSASADVKLHNSKLMFLFVSWPDSPFFPALSHTTRHCLFSDFSRTHGPLRPHDITDPRRKVGPCRAADESLLSVQPSSKTADMQRWAESPRLHLPPPLRCGSIWQLMTDWRMPLNFKVAKVLSFPSNDPAS